MIIQTKYLKEMYGRHIKTVAKDERFYAVPGANEYIMSTYCRLFKKTLTGYRFVPLIFGSIWREYEIKFDDEDASRKMSINRLAGLVFFSDVPNAFLEPFHDDWRWQSWKVENLHLYRGSKEQRRQQRIERIKALCENRKPNYDDELIEHSFKNRFVIPDGVTINQKISRDYGNMRSRCVNIKTKERNPKYKYTKLCDEWRDNPNIFSEWWIRNRYYYPGEELQLDKDILGYGESNMYSPDYCCFVPRRINDMFVERDSKLKYAITRIDNKNGTISYRIAPNAFRNGKTHTFENYFDALNCGRKLKAESIRQVVREERRSGYMPQHILDAMEIWADLVQMGKIKMLEPSPEVLKKEGII